MSEKKGWGSTVLGWFVVPQEGEGDAAPAAASDESIDDVIARAAAEPAAASPVTFTRDVPSAPGGQVDFPAVFEAAGIDAEEQGRVQKAKDLLAALPAGTDAMVKKQIVEASLKAFGVPIDHIIEAGVQEIQALEGYVRNGSGDTQKVLEDAQRRSLEYEEEIKRLKTVMEERVNEQNALMRTCNAKKLEIQGVLEFFGQEAVARVVHDSPKLIEPKG